MTDPPVWRTDGQTELRWLRRAKAVAAFARKNERPGMSVHVCRFVHTDKFMRTCSYNDDGRPQVPGALQFLWQQVSSGVRRRLHPAADSRSRQYVWFSHEINV